MKTSTGLKYVIIKKNGGKKPSRGTTINIDYTGYLEDGQLLILVLKVKRKYLVNWTLTGRHKMAISQCVSSRTKGWYDSWIH
jgi:hypothetical protein